LLKDIANRGGELLAHVDPGVQIKRRQAQAIHTQKASNSIMEMRVGEVSFSRFKVGTIPDVIKVELGNGAETTFDIGNKNIGTLFVGDIGRECMENV
jgi:hypothetical protein